MSVVVGDKAWPERKSSESIAMNEEYAVHVRINQRSVLPGIIEPRNASQVLQADSQQSNIENNPENTRLTSVRSEMRMPGTQRGNDYEITLVIFFDNTDKCYVT